MMMQHGWNVDGRQFSEQRGPNMTQTQPPADYRWTTVIAADYRNNPPQDHAAHEVWKALRLEFLAQFEMQITESGKYRYWRWLDKKGATRWWERRPLSDPMPTTPGLWPADN
jgi:hypothetical protein